MTENIACLFCGSRQGKPLYASLPHVVCCPCGLVYTTPRMPKEAVREFYSQDYFENHLSEEMGYDNYVSDRDLVEKTFQKRLQDIQRQWGIKIGKLLDVGCATGFFLHVARQMGWEVSGVEISDYCGDYAQRTFDLTLHRGFFTEVPLPAASFDLITMWDYIEHSLTPDKDIDRAFQLLKPGGLLVMATPDMGSWPARIFKENWIGFKEHEHLYYFTKKDLLFLLERSGFKVLSTSHTGKYVSLNFFAKRLMSYFKILGWAVEQISSAAFLKERRFYCNPFDIIYVVARKP